MKKRERLDAELEEVHRQLARMSTGASVLQPSRRASSLDPEDESPDEAEKRIVTPGRLTTAAFQLAGYAVATLTLGRSIPGTIALGANAEYDVGRCSETDLHAIWAVGDLAAERARGDGCPWEPGPSIVIFKMEGDSGDAFRDDRKIAADAPDREQTGMHLVAIFRGRRRRSDRALAEAAAAEGIWTMPLSDCFTGPPSRQGFVLGYAGSDPSELRAAARRLGAILRDSN